MNNSTIRPRHNIKGRGRRQVFVTAIVAALLISSSSLRVVEAAAGDLDPTFGTGGRVTTTIAGTQEQARDVAVQADGKIIAAGYAFVTASTPFNFDFALARYNPDGTLDPSFGAGGKVITDFFGRDDVARAVAIQNDGKIVVAGSAANGGDASTLEFALARYNPDGTLDATFGAGGKVTTDISGFGDEARALVIQADNKIVVAGSVPGVTTNTDFALARYNANGSLDPTFGSAGKVITDFSGDFDDANDVAIQGDGKIIAAGSTRGVLTDYDFALARYNANGSLDPTFGSGGRVVTPFETGSVAGIDAIDALAIQGDGKITAAGTTLAGVGNYNFALARYNANGSLDLSFGAGGRVTTDFTGQNDQAYDLAIQPDGKLVAVGQAITLTSLAFGIARYNVDGSLDPSFGAAGRVTTEFPPGSGAAASAVAIQADGRIIAAGFRLNRGTPFEEFALARYLGDAPPCSITCPSSIATSNTPGQCGTVVNYTAPSGPACGPVACFPPPGSVFPIGATTVTCEPAAGVACSFNVTVVDTQAPTINCPAGVTAVTAPGSAGTVVSFPAPNTTDNCSAATTVCSPPSGSSFAVGTTTVTCTARDAAGNTASCSFTVTVFDVCLQDEANPQTSILLNSRTGEYRFCCAGVTFTGRGAVSRRGSTILLEHNTADRRLVARSDQSVSAASASLQSPPGRLMCTITDRNTRNNTCSCR
jgi:uncharacterized delta-60 repeat protein